MNKLQKNHHHYHHEKTTLILVLGAHGQLGQDLKESLLIKSKTFSSTFQLLFWDRDDIDFELAENKIIESITQMELNKKFSSIWVINTAAFTDTSACEENPDKAYQINAFAVHAWAKLVRSWGANARMIHFSTDYVFDGQKQVPYLEGDLCYPLNVYGRSKLMGEYLLRDSAPQHYIFRVSSLYGVRGRNFIETLLSKAQTQTEFSIVSDQIMSPTHTWDVSLFISDLIFSSSSLPYGTYHFAGQGECSWFEFAQEFFSIAQQKNLINRMNQDKGIKLTPISAKSYPSRLQRPCYSVLSCDKLGPYFRPPYWKSSLQDYFERRAGQSQASRP